MKSQKRIIIPNCKMSNVRCSYYLSSSLMQIFVHYIQCYAITRVNLYKYIAKRR